MALRIGGRAPMPPVEEEQLPVEEAPVEEPMPEDLLSELPESLEEGLPEEATAGGMVDPVIAGYKGPEQGPFACSNCIHFREDGSCEIIAGPVDPEGVCNLFTSAAPVQQEEMPVEEEMPEEEMPMEEPMPEEVPVEGE